MTFRTDLGNEPFTFPYPDYQNFLLHHCNHSVLHWQAKDPSCVRSITLNRTKGAKTGLYGLRVSASVGSLPATLPIGAT